MSHDALTRLVATCLGDPAVHAIVQRLADAGHDTYVVGGPVRDAFDGVDDIDDIDLVTVAHPQQVADLLDGIGTVNLVGESFGVVKVHADGTDVDVATARADRYEPGSRKPDVVYADRVDDDLQRRDFTVNAMAVRLPTDPAQQPTLLDPYDGRQSLADRQLDTPTDPAISFGDDPLRIHRAWRFAATRQFTLDGRLYDAARQVVADGLLGSVSAERKQAEAAKVLAHPEPTAWAQAVGLMVQLDVLDDVFPGIRGVDTGPLAWCGSPLARLAGLFACSDQRTTPGDARALLPAAKWPTATVRDVSDVLELVHARTSTQRRGLIGKADDPVVDAAVELTHALGRPSGQPLLADAAVRHLWRLPLPVGGADVLAAGVPAGPKVGEALAYVSDLQVRTEWATADPASRRRQADQELAVWLSENT